MGPAAWPALRQTIGWPASSLTTGCLLCTRGVGVGGAASESSMSCWDTVSRGSVVTITKPSAMGTGVGRVASPARALHHALELLRRPRPQTEDGHPGPRRRV